MNPSVGRLPTFLLHLGPQVTRTKSDTSDLFDKQSGTVRSPREQLEKRIAASLRRCGKSRAAQDMNAFVRKYRDKSTALLAKIFSELPRVNGQPNLDALGDPNEIVN